MGLPVASKNDSSTSKPSPETLKTYGTVKTFEETSPALPFGQAISLASISGPTYLTPQTVVQQVAYSLSDRLWTFSPETFDLDAAVVQWYREQAHNALDYTPRVDRLDVRSGAASIALGYGFSKDFDASKRHLPQSIIATTASLGCMRASLEQLALLYGVASPLVIHAAAVNYDAAEASGLVTDYVAALAAADEIGLGAVLSLSAHETQHTALLATAMAQLVPTLHVYDGVSLGGCTTRFIDTLDANGLQRNADALLKEYHASARKHDSLETKVASLFKAFNSELGTEYQPFEYAGHPEAETILVALGTVESSLAARIATALAKQGTKVGVVAVRLYRPFLEEDFIRSLPRSAMAVGVLGQVANDAAVRDSSVQSILYQDVLAALTFADGLDHVPRVVDIKYPREQSWSAVSMASAFQFVSATPVLESNGALSVNGFSLANADDRSLVAWDSDTSSARTVFVALARAFASNAACNVAITTKLNDLVEGGIQRVDIRQSSKTIETLHATESANLVYVGDEKILKKVDAAASLAANGVFVLRLPNFKPEDIEKRLPVALRQRLQLSAAELHILDPCAIQAVADDPRLETYLIELALLSLSQVPQEAKLFQTLASLNGNDSIFEDLSESLSKALQRIDIPMAWAESTEEENAPKVVVDVSATGFLPVDKEPEELPPLSLNWQDIAKGLAFKEAYKTSKALRPDLATKTWTIHLLEHRRLTPITYDRNIMHLEFDLGSSGMKYEIGDSLGIHPRNSEADVEAFISAYGVDPEAIVNAPSREDPNVLRASTTYYALTDLLDIFGKPSRQFYEQLSAFASDEAERKALAALGGPEGAVEFQRRSEVDTTTFADVLAEFPSARPSIHELVQLVAPIKRREYSIASCQKVNPTRIALMIVTVLWRDPRGRDRRGLATQYLDALQPGAAVTVSLKPSVMKLPLDNRAPIILAGLGTGLAPFRAFAQYRAWQRLQAGREAADSIGPILLYMGSRHQREEYCYGEEWEAYRSAGVLSLLSCAFSRDQPQKIYIQDRMRETATQIEHAYLEQDGAFYLCGPTWPVPDVTAVLEDVVRTKATREGRKVRPRAEIERLKDENRYVLEVY